MSKKEKSGFVFVKKGYYYVRITYYTNDERKQKDIATGIRVGNPDSRAGKKAKKEADTKMVEALQNFGLPGEEKKDNSEQMFADTVREWMKRQEGVKAPSTISGYQYCANDVITYFAEICPVRTVDLTSKMIEDYQVWERARRSENYVGKYGRKRKYMDGSGVENTIKHRTTLIGSVLQYAKRDDLVVRNMASPRDCQVELPKPMRHLFPLLTEREVSGLIHATKRKPLWFRMVVLLAALFGLRRSEICGLRVDDIDWERGTITIRRTVTQQTVNRKNSVTSRPFTKNRRPKVFALVEPVERVLRALLAEHEENEKLFGSNYCHDWDGYLLRYPDGKLISPNTVTDFFMSFNKQAGLKEIRLHDLRHSCASILLAIGYDMRTIQEIMGHAQMSTTMLYTHPIGDTKHTAVATLSSRLVEEDNL
jgi:integrase